MYQVHFGLKYYPFDIAPKADQLFDYAAAREVRDRLRHLLELRGIGLLTSEAGSGKTTMCRQVVSQLHPNTYRVCYVTLSTGSVLDSYNVMAHAFGLEHFYSRAAAFKAIQDEVSRLVVASRQYPVLIFDEAHHLHPTILEELRLLTNYTMDSEKRLCLLLVGLSELRRRLQLMAAHAALAQRIVIRCSMGGLTHDEVGGYINHRLQLAGCESELFDPPAIHALSLASKGLPRVLDRLTHLALVAAAQTQSRIVTADHVTIACDEQEL